MGKCGTKLFGDNERSRMIRNALAWTAIHLKSRGSWASMEKAKKLYFSSPQDMENFQKERHYELLRYAYQHTRYYHKIFDEIGLFDGENIRESRLCDIPVLTKEIIRREGDALISDEAEQRGAYLNTSGGSTGEPVAFYQDRFYFSHNFGDKLLFGILNGKMPGDKEIKLWGSERDLLEGSIGFQEKLINWCYNRTFLNSFILTSENMDAYIQTINKVRPRQIWTYADSIYQLARYVNDHGRTVFSPRNIVTTAGVLYEEMRSEIRKAFPGSHVINQYGSREAGVIGCEVGDIAGIRIFDHTVKVEILDEVNGRVSEFGEGELLITNFTNYTMPLIRYRIGDTGVKTEARGYPGSFSVLKNVTGRTNTHLKKADGSLVHGEYATHLFYNKTWIENFKVIQHDYENMEFQIVIKAGSSEKKEDIDQMVRDLQAVMGSCQIKITYLDVIPRLKSGKYQYVVSEI